MKLQNFKSIELPLFTLYKEAWTWVVSLVWTTQSHGELFKVGGVDRNDCNVHNKILYIKEG